MKITGIEPFHLAIPYDDGAGSLGHSSGQRATQDAVYLRVDTDDGVTGWGEAFGFGACTMSYLAVQRVVSPLAVGRDPLDIAGLMVDLQRRTRNMSRNGPVAYALSGLDIALWDIAGKVASKPVHALLGGATRSDIPAYASLLRLGTPDRIRRIAVTALERGYLFLKLHERTVEAVAAARAVAGDGVGLMLDTNCTWTTDEAVQIAPSLAPYCLTWLEEPIFPPDDFAGLARLRLSCDIPLAAGENLGNVMDVSHILAAGAVDIVQPDLAKMGGITEIMKALDLARAAGVAVEPHSPLYGPALAATLHVLATMHEPVIGEFYYADLEANPIGAVATPVKGRFRVPTGAGLGIEVDEAALARYRVA